MSWLERQIWQKPTGHPVQPPSPYRPGSCSPGRGRDSPARGHTSSSTIQYSGSQAPCPGPRFVKHTLLVWFLFLQGRLSSRAGVKGHINSRTKHRNPHKCSTTHSEVPSLGSYHNCVQAGTRQPQSFPPREPPRSFHSSETGPEVRRSPNSSQPRNQRADEKRGATTKG